MNSFYEVNELITVLFVFSGFIEEMFGYDITSVCYFGWINLEGTCNDDDGDDAICLSYWIYVVAYKMSLFGKTVEWKWDFIL